MKVSTRVEYGLVALTDIVIHSQKGKAVSSPEIAQRQNISHKYLEHILLLLRQAGFITAQKGLRGGYALARPADQISMADVLNALDNNILADTEPQSGEISDLGNAINECFWNEINSHLNEYTGNLKLSDFADRCSGSLADRWDLYVI
jgi:Rrf2 family protein